MPDLMLNCCSLFLFSLQAGLLGCEAVLSSMALMQASSMAAPPKKMMAPLGHGPPQREGPDRAPQSHMILPSGMSCPPLVRICWEWNWGCYVYFFSCKIQSSVIQLAVLTLRSRNSLVGAHHMCLILKFQGDNLSCKPKSEINKLPLVL